jgi:hypothetical protein
MEIESRGEIGRAKAAISSQDNASVGSAESRRYPHALEAHQRTRSSHHPHRRDVISSDKGPYHGAENAHLERGDLLSDIEQSATQGTSALTTARWLTGRSYMLTSS